MHEQQHYRLWLPAAAPSVLWVCPPCFRTYRVPQLNETQVVRVVVLVFQACPEFSLTAEMTTDGTPLFLLSCMNAGFHFAVGPRQISSSTYFKRPPLSDDEAVVFGHFVVSVELVGRIFGAANNFVLRAINSCFHLTLGSISTCKDLEPPLELTNHQTIVMKPIP